MLPDKYLLFIFELSITTKISHVAIRQDSLATIYFLELIKKLKTKISDETCVNYTRYYPKTKYFVILEVDTS